MQRRMKARTDILFCVVVSLASVAIYWTVITLNEARHLHSNARHPAGAGISASEAETNGPPASGGASPPASTPDNQETPSSPYQQRPGSSSATNPDIWGAAYINSEGARHTGDWKRSSDWDDSFQRVKDPLVLDPAAVPPLKVPPFPPPLQIPEVQMPAPR